MKMPLRLTVPMILLLFIVALATWILHTNVKMAEDLVRSDTRTIQVTLPNEELFFPGSSSLMEGGGDVVQAAIKEKLIDGVKKIIVEGHTDDVPIHTARFPSNWELSCSRASGVARYIIDEMRFPPQFVVVSGFGAYRPKHANTSDEFRAINRRVEIKILKDKRAITQSGKTPTAKEVKKS